MKSRHRDTAQTDGRTQRQLRMGEELRHALAEILARGHIHDPELRDAAITVTEVRVSPDLRNATAFVTPLGGEKLDEIVAALKRARGFFRAQIAKSVEARFVPEIRFEPDRSFEEAARVGQLIREARERDHGDDDGTA